MVIVKMEGRVDWTKEKERIYYFLQVDKMMISRNCGKQQSGVSENI